MSSFKNLLKIGEQFENEVALPYILENFKDYWVETTHDYKTTSYGGPKLRRHGMSDITLPDFKLLNPANNHQLCIEAKFKSKVFSISGNWGREYIAIEKFKVEQYIKASEIFRADLKFLIGRGDRSELFLLDTYIPHYFNNSFFRGEVCAFDVTDKGTKF